MSVPPQQSSRLTSAAALAPSAATAQPSSPAAVDDRRADDSAAADAAAYSAVNGQQSNATAMIDDPPAAVAARSPSRSASLTSAATLCDEASAIGTAATSGSAVSTPLPAGSPVRKLYRHALESIFAFASLSELHSLSQVGHDWSAAVMTMAPIHASFKIRDSAHLNSILEGRLRRHISALPPARPQFDEPLHYELSLPDLIAASTALPGLRGVRVRLPQCTGQLENWEFVFAVLSRFTALSYLEFDVCTDPDLQDEAIMPLVGNRIMEMCSQLPSATILETLKFGWRQPFSTDLSIAPLQALTQLRVLELRLVDARRNRSLSDDQIADLCALTSLEQLLLPLHGLNSDVLPRLCPPGSTRSWTKLSSFEVTPEVVPCFASLSSLTFLHVTWRADPDCSCLSQLTRLVGLSLCGVSGSPIDADILTRALKECTLIESLWLTGLPLVSRHLEDLLPCFLRLARVSLRGLDHLESLRCFATPALAASLQALTLFVLQLASSPSADREIVHLYMCGLRSLRTLTCLAPESEEHRRAFVGGVQFPQLQTLWLYDASQDQTYPVLQLP